MDEVKLDAAQQPPELTEATGQPPAPTLFPVVGIGTSAGGLRALQRFLTHTPADSGLAFVIVTHLSPEHESHLPALLQPNTAMPMDQVAEETQLLPDQVYVIPPGRNLQAIDSHLRLAPLEPERRQRAPIDHFLRTLAGSHESLAIAVILTGTGSDGALGLRHIKEAGGLTVVQDPSEAEYDSMPQSALATGDVEMVLPVAEIPGRLVEYVRNRPQVPVPADGEPLPEDVGELVQKILTQVRAYTGQDFLRYKSATILRRIRRRMQIHGFATLGEYLKYLRDHDTEVQALYHDFLITVTNFFRDPEAFAYLAREVIPKIFQDKNGGEGVRVWTVGCATGEEAYSVAMLLLEHASGLDHPSDLQIFASDLSEEGLRQAREGFYPETIAADVSPERLERFFTKEQGGYRIRQAVRERVLFTPHSLLKDPPFSRLDLICCRNLLIYVERDAQQEVMQLFHYALRPDGYLFLGSAETVEGSELFHQVSRKQSIYQRQPMAPRQVRLPSLPLMSGGRRLPTLGPMVGGLPEPHPGYGGLHTRVVERYAPPSLLVNPDQNIVYFAEGADRYLHQPAGEPTNQVLRRVRAELRIELTTALYRAQEKGEASQSPPLPLTIGNEPRQVSLVVQPIFDPELTGFVLIFFLESAAEATLPRPAHTSEQSDLVRDLEAELAETKKRLQVTIEEYETSQEEMRAVNEELQSMNEELRSAAEELETSKEELQSVNEELLTVNQENKNKIEELNQLTGDLQNLLVSTEIATLFLDRELRIKRFTPRISDLFNILSTDRGRPLADITHKLGTVNLQTDAQQVLRTLLPIEREVQSNGAAWYIMRLLPYRTPDDRIDGVVLTFVDITINKANELALHNAKEYAESIVHTIPDALLVLDPDLRVQMANEAFYEIFQVSRVATEGRLIYELGNNQWQIPALRTLLEDILPENKVFIGYEVDHIFESIGRRTMLLNGRRLDHVQLILLAIADITERKEAEEAVRASEEQLSTFVNATSDIVYEMSADWRMMRFLTGKEFIATTEQPRADWTEAYIPADERERVWAVIDQAIATRSNFELEYRVIRLDGSIGWTFSRAIPLLDEQGAVVKWFGAASDITERKRTEANLAFLADVMADFAPLAGVEELMQQVGKKLAEYLGLERCDFSVVEEEADRITTIYDWRRSADAPSVLGEHHISTFLTPAARERYRAGELVVINDVRNHPLINAPAEMMAALRIGSVVDAPYLENGRWKFLLSACRSAASSWREDEVALIRELATRIYLRLERARNEAMLAADLQAMQLLRDLGARLVNEGDSQTLYQEILATAITLLGADAGSLQLVDEQSEELVLLAAQGFTPEMNEWLHRLDASPHTVRGRALTSNTRRLIDFEQPTAEDPADLYRLHVAAGYLSAQSTPLVARSGRPIGMIFTHWQEHHRPSERELHFLDLLVRQAADLIEQHQADEQLRQSEERLWLMIENLPGGAAFIVDRNLRYVLAAGEALAPAAFQPVDYVGKTLFEVLAPEVAASYEARYRQALAGTGFVYEHDAHGRAYITRGTPLSSSNGEIYGVLAVAYDITDRKNAEVALRQSEERLRLLIESAKDFAIFTFDGDRRITSWSSGAEAIFGYTEAEILGQPADILFTPEDQAQGVPAAELTTAHTTGRAEDERWHSRKDGSRFYASGIVTLLREGEEVRGYVKIARDLTERQAAEAERERLLTELTAEREQLQKLNRTLEQRVDERTAVLAAKNRELDRFAHLAAHDLKEPLRGIQRLAEWIEEAAAEQLPPAAQTHLAKLQQRVRRITQLVDDLLAYSRVGRTTYSVEMVEPTTLIQQVVELLDPPPGCTIIIHQPLPRLMTARIPLETVFLNLIHNAIKHHHQSAACHVEIAVIEQGAFVEFALSDNGPGIDPAHQARIFDLFQTLRPRDEVEGSGMGLAIVQRILESYGGAIRVESNPEGGVTFHFTWPRVM